MKTTARVALFAVFGAFFLPATDAFACTCLYRHLGSPCLVSSDVNAIFSGTVTKIVPGSVAAPRTQTRVTIRTDRWYKGSGSRVVEVSTSPGSGFCEYGFKKGEKYLVFAHGSNGRWSTTMCTATTPFSKAAHLLEYLEEAKLVKKARFEGTWMAESFAPVRGAIVLAGPAPMKLETDAHGRFVINDLPADRYTVSFQPFDRRLTPPARQEVTLAAGQCTTSVVRSCHSASCVPSEFWTIALPR